MLNTFLHLEWMLHSLKKIIFTVQAHSFLVKENSPFWNVIILFSGELLPYPQKSSFGNRNQTSLCSCRGGHTWFPLCCHLCHLLKPLSCCQGLIQILSPDSNISAGPGATQLCASALLSFSSTPAAPPWGAAQPAGCPGAGDHPLPSQCRAGNVSQFRRAAFRDPRPPGRGAASSRRLWRSFCASSLGDGDGSWQFLCMTVKGMKKRKTKKKEDGGSKLIEWSGSNSF